MVCDGEDISASDVVFKAKLGVDVKNPPYTALMAVAEEAKATNSQQGGETPRGSHWIYWPEVWWSSSGNEQLSGSLTGWAATEPERPG